MKILIYDTETFSRDWFAVFYDPAADSWRIIHNDARAVESVVFPPPPATEPVLCGFNVKHYDQYILKGILEGFTPPDLKKLNDWIIGGHEGWQYAPLKHSRVFLQNCDLMDDMQNGLSLKAIEGHLGMDIRETEVDFTIDRELTKEECEQTVFYCKHDVQATYELYKLRKSYLETKIALGKRKNIPPEKALSLTNAKLTAAMLDAHAVRTADERDYRYPDNLLREYVPEAATAFFDRMHDSTVSDETLFSEKLDLTVGGCPVTLGFGGIHGAVTKYRYEKNDQRRLVNYDVGSYYPHLMTLCGYTSRALPSPATFERVLDERMKAKAAGDKKTANALKLVVNTTYGAMLNRYNELYDPLMGRSVCVSGQLYLLELATHLTQAVENLRIVQLNTDGIMFETDSSTFQTVEAIVNEWQARTGFELERDDIDLLVQKDVNNYLERQEGGSEKVKGGWLTRGIAQAGAWNINNTAVIVADAIKAYFLHGVPPEDTVSACDEMLKFQYIAKASGKYIRAFQLVGGKEVPVQKCNRVYAAVDPALGTLYKVKAEGGMVAKIENLPPHCLIDNGNEHGIGEVDKDWYINEAKERIGDFMAEENLITQAGTAPDTQPKRATAYERLLRARVRFLEAGSKQSGKNFELKYEYFELKDIVPTATRIFEEEGLLPVMTVQGDTAILCIAAIDNPNDEVIFSLPFVRWEGNKGVNPLQAVGASITYYRRYLYLIALDICVADEVEPALNRDTALNNRMLPGNSGTQIPVSKPAREATKAQLTSPEGAADALQVSQLKDALKKVLANHPDRRDWAVGVSSATDKLTNVTKAQCEQYLSEAADILGGNA